MLLQTSDYDLMTPEPQTDEESREKTGLPCFLNLVVSQCVKLVAVNLLFLIGCIPIVTIPLSLYAMNQVIHRMIRGEPVKCFQSYRKSFRYDWKKGYIAFLLTLLPLGGAGVGMWFYFCRVRSNPLFFVPFLVCSTTFLVTLLSSGYLYGLLEREKPMKETVRFAVILGITKPLRAVLAALGCYGLMFLAMSIFPLSGLYLLLLGFSFPCLLGSFFLRTVLNTSGSGKEDGR